MQSSLPRRDAPMTGRITDEQALRDLERDAYRAAAADGIIDLFAGASLVWIGVAWIWLPSLAGVAGVLPAVFISVVLAARKRFVAERTGYVKWSEPRRRWEHRNLVLVFAAGVLTFALGIGAFIAVESGADGMFEAVGPAILAWLLSLTAVGLAVVFSAPRMLLYALILAASGFVAAAAEANPGWPLLASGIAIVLVGALMLWRFVGDNPVVADDLE